MKNLKLNYREVALLMGKKSTDIKEDVFTPFFEDKESVTLKNQMTVNELNIYFPLFRSVDTRYDGKPSIEVHLDLKKSDYKKHLKSKKFIESGKFSGGASLFFKICDKDQLDHIKKVSDTWIDYRKQLKENLQKRKENAVSNKATAA